MTAAIAERVAAGAAFLDVMEPGWDARIDLDRLSIGSSCGCILGQLHGSFGAGLVADGLLEGDCGRDIALGFFWAGTREVDGLTAEWRRVIEARRSEASGGAE